LHPALFFLINAPTPPQTYTLSLHDALPIYDDSLVQLARQARASKASVETALAAALASTGSFSSKQDALKANASAPSLATQQVVIDRKSTRLNSSHDQISYAVFCLKKKKKTQ